MSCPGTAGAGCSTWSAQCLSLLQAAGMPTTGLVDQNGAPMSVLNNNTWGITYDTCQQYCNWTAMPLPSYFDYDSFSGAMTNYYLPWLALAAQLPYENGSTWDTFMAFCLSLGSPALITYSLMITLLNRIWVHDHFSGLIERAKKVADRCKSYGERIEAVLYFLKEAQQAPLRATQVQFQLASLVVLPQNQHWWKSLAERLEHSRRGVTFSLVAQILLAAFVWLFTIISSFAAAFGDSTTALQIAAATLWIWLVPITFGWITVGTQNASGTIKRALEADMAHRAVIGSHEPVDCKHQEGIQVRSGLTPQPSRGPCTQRGTLESPPSEHPGVPTTLGMDIRGDEALEGPVYNYARVFTWWSFSTLLHDTLSKTLAKIEDERAWERERGLLEGEEKGEGRGDGPRVSECCGLQTDTSHRILAYAKDTRKVYVRMGLACLAALFVQWATTGSAFIMAYLTPTVGLGCRSGSYMLYGAASTIVLFCMVCSMLLSHAAMRRYQSRYEERTRPAANGDGHANPNRAANGEADGEEDEEEHPDMKASPGMFDDMSHSALCVAAVGMRAVGKTLAFCNMVWLMVSSLFEYIGLYNICWCKSCFPQFGHHGWAVLFRTDQDFQRVAQGPWVGGIMMSTIFCVIVLVFFVASVRRSK